MQGAWIGTMACRSAKRASSCVRSGVECRERNSEGQTEKEKAEKAYNTETERDAAETCNEEREQQHAA